jgi:hypothetical protein
VASTQNWGKERKRRRRKDPGSAGCNILKVNNNNNPFTFTSIPHFRTKTLQLAYGQLTEKMTEKGKTNLVNAFC